MPISYSCACGRRLRSAEEHAGKRVRCPQCQALVRVPAPAGAAAPLPAPAARAAAPAPPRRDASSGCPVCLTPLDDAGPGVSCPACATRFHADCWEENGGCAVYGCAQAPATEKRTAIETPVSYW